MQFNTLLLIASLVGATMTAPVTENAKGKAVINSRFLTYENEARDVANEKNAVINSRFLTYENDKRDDASEEAVSEPRLSI